MVANQQEATTWLVHKLVFLVKGRPYMDNQSLIATKSTLLFLYSYHKDIMGYHGELGEVLADVGGSDCRQLSIVMLHMMC